MSHYLKKHDVAAEQLFATAIYQAYLNGIRHPKVLVRAFGITSTTAVKYLHFIDPRLCDEIDAKLNTRHRIDLVQNSIKQ